MEAVTGLHRKSLTRLLRAPTLARQPRRRQRGRRYGIAVRPVIALVWESPDYICADRLTPAPLPTARHLARFGECALTAEVAEQLATIRRATVQRLLGTLLRPTPRLPQHGPERANHARRGVPMGRVPWQIRTCSQTALRGRGSPGQVAGASSRFTASFNYSCRARLIQYCTRSGRCGGSP